MFDDDDTDAADQASEADTDAEADDDAEADQTADAAPQGDADASEDEAAVDDNDDNDDDQAEKPGKFRQRLADAEEARDTLADQLARQQAVVFERTCADAGLPLAVAKAAGLDVSKFIGEDGLVDTAALAAIADEVRAENKIPARPAPNPLAGQGQKPAKTETLGEVLKAVARG